MNSNIAIKLSDDSFRVKAFAEYCSRAEQRFSNLIAATTAVPDYLPELEIDRELTQQEISDIVSQIKTDFSLSTSVVSFNEGYISLDDLLSHLVREENRVVCSLPSAEPITQTRSRNRDEEEEVATFYDELDVPVNNALGESIGTAKLSIGNIADQLQSSYHSIVCLTASADAFYQKMVDSSTDVISIFNDKIADIFSNPHADISNTVSYLKGKVLSTRDPGEFLTSVLANVGIVQESEAESGSSYTQSQCDIANYTGASPSCALDFSSTTKAITTVAKVGATVVVGIAKGIASLAKTLFSKVASKVTQVLVDPNDLEVINNDGFSTVDGFTYSDGTQHSVYLPAELNLNTAELIAEFVDDLGKYTDRWFAMKTRFGEFQFKWSGVSGRLSGSTGIITFSSCMIYYKPRVINYQVLCSCCSDSLFDSTTHVFLGYDAIEQFLDNVASIGSSLYTPAGDGHERDTFIGLACAFILDAKLSQIALDQMTGAVLDSGLKDPRTWTFGELPSTITNLHWVRAFSGYDDTYPQFPSFDSHFPWYVAVDRYITNAAIPFSLLSCAVCGLGYEFAFPNAQAPFVPFSNNHTDFEKPSYRIKTDSENKSAFNTFVTRAIVIIVVAIVAITAVVAIKKIARKRYFKHLSRQGRYDNKMWSGGVLTKKEQRQYLRSKRLVEGSGLFSGGLVAAASEKMNSATTDSSSAGGYTTILKKITGQ